MKPEPKDDVELYTKNDQSLLKIDAVIDDTTCKKMLFIYNSLQNGWSVRKKSDKYIFKKKHKGKKEIYQEAYLNTFIKENCIFQGET